MKLEILGTRGYIEPRNRRNRLHTATLVSYRGRRLMIVTHRGSNIVAGDERTVGTRVRALGRERGVEVGIAHDGMELVLR